MIYWAIITHHPDHKPHEWVYGRADLAAMIYDTREAAVEAATAAWEGTSVKWALMVIPGEEG